VFFLLSVTGCAAETLVPQDIVDAHRKDYSQKEMRSLNRDLKNIRETCFDEKTPAKEQPVYVATAGAPGACKSTILETYLHDKQNIVYVDPDQRALCFMINTYYQTLTCYNISQAKSPQDLLKDSYNKWREASNYVSNTLLNESYSGGYNIAHGATSTSSAIKFLYQGLKRKNYKIVLLLCGASDRTRVATCRHRFLTQGFLQESSQDLINKGTMFSERLATYFEYADEIYVYWTDDFLKGSTLAATYTKDGGLIVCNQKTLDCFVKKYGELN